MTIKIIIGADLVPTKSNYQYFEKGDVDYLIGAKLRNILEKSDFSIFNLEVPLFDGNNPIEKYGPNLKAPISSIKGLSKINPHFFTLANNHIYDHGKEGLKSTLNTLKKAGIEYNGVGVDIKDAAKPFFRNIKGIRLGIYSCSEHEFSSAEENKEGANAFDPLNSLDHISNLRKNVDYLIVLYHGGKEHYRYPSPDLQKICRRLVEKGADLVVCQHSHCVGCKEIWNNGTIIYGQGNFLFDDGDDEYWKSGLLIELSLRTGSHSIDFLPIVKVNEKVRLASDKEARGILNDFERRSKEISKTGFVKEKYKEFAEGKINGYLYAFSGGGMMSQLSRVINKISGYKYNSIRMKKIYRKKNRIILRNLIECEAHRELIIEGLKHNL